MSCSNFCRCDGHCKWDNIIGRFHDENCDNHHRLTKVVTIPSSLDKSLKGTYFVGQTPNMMFNNTIAAGALFNPPDSGVYLFVNVFTITNFSAIPLDAKIWINSTPPTTWTESPLVTTTNTAIHPTPNSKIQIIYTSDTSPIITGKNAFDRVVPGISTIVAEEDGKYIIPPNKYFIITLIPTASGPITAALAFGWWTTKISS